MIYSAIDNSCKCVRASFNLYLYDYKIKAACDERCVTLSTHTNIG